MTDGYYYTNSELGTAKRCLRKWFLGYVLQRQKPLKLHGSRQRGTLAHNALELYYASGDDPRDFVRAEGIRLRQEYLDAHHDDEVYEGQYDEDLREIEKMVDLVLAMIEGYVDWVVEGGVDADYELLNTEFESAVPFNEWIHSPRPVYLLGKMDARFARISDGFKVFFDHKTVPNLAELPKWAHMNPQMLTYHLLEYLTQDEMLTDGGMYNMLRTVKRSARANPPFFGRHEVRHNVHQLRNFFTQTVALIQRLEQLRELADVTTHQHLCPPNPTNDCAWSCDFYMICPMMDDGSDWQGLLNDAYQVGNPLARYQLIEKG